MQCRNCGADYPDLRPNEQGRIPRFCTKCGAPLQTFTQNSAAAEPPAPPPTAPMPSASSPTGDPGAPKPTKKKNPLVWILIAVTLVALLVVGYFTIHIWKPADCENPETCAICGRQRGEALGHDWTDATCTEPKTCDRCGKTVGEALGHDWTDATCTEPKTCDRCGETEGEALGHDWQAATYDAPETCARCGETKGDPLGWVGRASFSVDDETTYIGNASGSALVFDEPLVGARKMTAYFMLTSYTGNPFGTFAVYAHSAERGWYSVATFQVTENDVDKMLSVPITFSDEPTIDKLLFISQKNANFTFEYSANVGSIQVTEQGQSA